MLRNGLTYANAVLPTPGGPYISVNSPREIPTAGFSWLKASSSLPCKKASRLFSPVEIGLLGVDEMFWSAWDADTVGRRSCSS